MPYGVVYAPEAADQLEELYRYIAERRSPVVAERYTSAVIETCEGLALFPLRGVSREDIRPGLRVTHHGGRTVIAYAVDQEPRRVSILGVLYGGQDLARALAEGGDA
ncbi:type II toxin-antitoxin system RelE/ParE family toxin [Piscinibacter sp. SJAQ100]|uniref:Type II toxin-antitoxin system RelE/ParE family toxin n=1 Tax=Aquariibacter albus TaxID=2759899 RepID=A0A839HJ18_9BURK|nr:type II toxin-antitoxin system RelE/ParE family toxin [Aquariibacter albus]